MSSIAYITDAKMIEFHRLNGNDAMNFWRPSASKRFSDFNSGDLLFFLAKGTERPKSKEKGIIGYGRYAYSESLSCRQMWSRHEVLNGFKSEEELKEGILKLAKSDKLPSRMSCLFLKDVVFFQSPVYLSQLGMKISNNIESFIYLDKEDPEMTKKILLEANEVGIDFWTSAVSKTNPSGTVFDDDLVWHLLKSHEGLIFSTTPQKEQQRNERYLKKYKELNPDLNWLDSNHQALIEFTHEGVVVYHPILGAKKEILSLIFSRLGQEAYLKKMSRKFPKDDSKTLKIRHISDINIKEELGIEIEFDCILFDDKK